MSRAPRVVHVTTAHTPTDNRIFRKECVSLAEAGFDVHLVAVADSHHQVHGVKVVALPRTASRLSRMVTGPLHVWRALRRLRPDLLHVHDPELIPLAVLWRWRFGTPTVYDAHEDLPKQVMGKPYLPRNVRPLVARGARLVERAADRWLDGIVAATPAIARNYGRAPVTLVQNWPWLRDFPSVQELTAGGRSVAYIGGITDTRGAVEMMSAVARSQMSAHLVLAGPVASPELLKRVTTDIGTTYLGRLPVEDMPAVLAASQVGLALFHPLPNHLECQTTKLFEYMAAGRPFIASNFPAWRSLVAAYDCGIFVDPLDVDAVTDAIDLFLRDPGLSKQMGARGRAAMEGHFQFEDEARKLVAVTATLTRANSAAIQGADSLYLATDGMATNEGPSERRNHFSVGRANLAGRRLVPSLVEAVGQPSLQGLAANETDELQ